VHDVPLHFIPIGDGDGDFIDSQEPADYGGRESSCDELNDEEFEDAEEDLHLEMTLEDLLPWSPELQFFPESLKDRGRLQYHSQLLRAQKEKRQMGTNNRAGMDVHDGGSDQENMPPEGMGDVQRQMEDDMEMAAAEAEENGERR
jgi:hypothetical protein